MNQLIKVEPMPAGERKRRIEERKKILKMKMDYEEFHNIFESGEDQYMWLDHYRKLHERQRKIKEFGYDPDNLFGDDPFPHTAD